MKKTTENLVSDLDTLMNDSFEQALCDLLDFKKEGKSFKEFNDLQNSDFNSNFELHENIVEAPVTSEGV